MMWDVEFEFDDLFTLIIYYEIMNYELLHVIMKLLVKDFENWSTYSSLTSNLSVFLCFVLTGFATFNS